MKFTHYKPQCLSDKIAYYIVKAMRIPADLFFAKRYGHRAVVLETVAAVPGMVGGMLLHLKCLRKFQDDRGWIKTLLAEAENERVHLMTFIQIARPSWFERFLVLSVQFIFSFFYFLIYIFSARTAHRIVGYLEEEAVISYTQYLEEIEKGHIKNVKAPESAIKYWNLPADARLKELVVAVREDEAHHRDNNHTYADIIDARHELKNM